MTGRRQLMMTTREFPPLTLEMGLDSGIRFQLSGSSIVVNTDGGRNYGAVGTHSDLQRNYPELYFGSHKCYANGEVWAMEQPLPLGFAPAGISKVELLECGRSDVNVGRERGKCYIVWTDRYVDVVDDAASSSRYLIKIFFA